MEISPDLKLIDAAHARWLVESRAETARVGYVAENHMLHPPPKERWTNLQKAFSIAVDALEQKVG